MGIMFRITCFRIFKLTITSFFYVLFCAAVNSSAKNQCYKKRKHTSPDECIPKSTYSLHCKCWKMQCDLTPGSVIYGKHLSVVLLFYSAKVLLSFRIIGDVWCVEYYVFCVLFYVLCVVFYVLCVVFYQIPVQSYNFFLICASFIAIFCEILWIRTNAWCQKKQAHVYEPVFLFGAEFYFTSAPVAL